MGRIKKYEDTAARAKAHRERRRAKWVEVRRDSHNALTGRLEALQRAVNDAAKAGDPLAKECSAGSIETMFEWLIAAFQSRG